MNCKAELQGCAEPTAWERTGGCTRGRTGGQHRAVQAASTRGRTAPAPGALVRFKLWEPEEPCRT